MREKPDARTIERAEKTNLEHKGCSGSKHGRGEVREITFGSLKGLWCVYCLEKMAEADTTTARPLADDFESVRWRKSCKGYDDQGNREHPLLR